MEGAKPFLASNGETLARYPGEPSRSRLAGVVFGYQKHIWLLSLPPFSHNTLDVASFGLGIGRWRSFLSVGAWNAEVRDLIAEAGSQRTFEQGCGPSSFGLMVRFQLTLYGIMPYTECSRRST